MSTELILSSFLLTSLEIILKKIYFQLFFVRFNLTSTFRVYVKIKRFPLTFYINILVRNLQLYDVHARFFPRSTEHTGKVA